jgi:PAS domain S-box-containing protein
MSSPTLRVAVLDGDPIARAETAASLRAQVAGVDVWAGGRARDLDDPDRAYDILVCEIALDGDRDGLAELSSVRMRFPDRPVILYTAHGNEDMAVVAIRSGAFDYIVKREGSMPRLVAAVRSAIERVRAAVVRRAETKKSLFDSSIGMLCVLSGDNRFQRVNPALVETLGYAADELIGRPFLDLVHQSDRDATAAALARLDGGGELVGWESRIRRRVGKYLWMSWQASSPGKGGSRYAIGRDTTRAKEVEIALEAIERRGTALLRTLPDEMVRMGKSGVYLEIFSGARGPERVGALVGRNIRDVEPPEVAELRLAKHACALRTGDVQSYEYSVAEASGRPCVIEARTVVCGPEETLTVLRDVTDERRAVAELHESEAKLRTIFEGAPIGMLISDATGRLSSANRAFADLVGVAASEVAPLGFHAFTHDEDLNRSVTGLSAVLAGEAPRYELDKRLVRGDGRVVWVHETLSRITDAAGRPVCAVALFEDVTERRRVEAQRHALEAHIRQTQKLESLGVLAGGVAHDFNNLLLAILGNADLALAELSPGSVALPRIQALIETTQRAAELCKQMLAYTGKGKFVVEAVDLSQIIEERAHLLAAVIPERTALRFDLEPDLPSVEADPSQVRRVVRNLVANAADAVESQGGVVTVRTGRLSCDRAYLAETYLDDGLPSGPYTFLEVRDNGPGIPPELLTRIFDPFFTTKFTGRGLGLSEVLGIVRAHRGAVKLETTEGRGTAIRALFPVHEAALVGRADRPHPAAHDRAHPTVLLVDDEEMIRSVGKRGLERAGFRVITAVNGRDAVEVFSRDPAEFDAVILDMTMPQMNGEEACGELRKIRRDVPIILSSGYGEGELASRFIADGTVEFLQKPYRMGALLDRLRILLGGTDSIPRS